MESFRDYVAVETLDGENKYAAEGLGLQDAKKGIIFESFPPVLHLQLKRFEYDMQRDAMVKINDRHEFPFEIDLGEFLDANADRSKPWNYKLHGVLVHSGDLHGGHYFALIKPDRETRWLKFDDDRVTPVTDREVLEENYGGEAMNGVTPTVQRNQVRPIKRFTNAYMLVYIRESAINEVLQSFTEEDTPPHLSMQTPLTIWVLFLTPFLFRAQTGRGKTSSGSKEERKGGAAPILNCEGMLSNPSIFSILTCLFFAGHNG